MKTKRRYPCSLAATATATIVLPATLNATALLSREIPFGPLVAISTSKTEPDWLEKMLCALESMKDFSDDWNSYGAPAPSKIAILSTSEFLLNLSSEDVQPQRVAASAMGGVGISIRNGNARKAYLEVRNDGSSYLLFSDGHSDPIVEAVRLSGRKETKDLIGRIRDYLHAECRQSS